MNGDVRMFRTIKGGKVMASVHVARCVLRAARHFCGEEEPMSRDHEGWVRLARCDSDESRDDLLRVDATDGNILFTCRNVGTADKYFFKKGILLNGEDIRKQLKSAKNEQYDYYDIDTENERMVMVNTKPGNLAAPAVAYKKTDYFPEIDHIIKEALEEADATLAYVNKIRNSERSRRIAEIGLNLQYFTSITRGIKDFTSAKSDQIVPIRTRFTQRHKPTIFEFNNSIDKLGLVLLMPLRWHHPGEEENGE